MVLAQKITEPLDLIAHGWEGGPLPLASGLVVQQPISLSRSAAEFSKSWGLDDGLFVAADLCDLPVELS